MPDEQQHERGKIARVVLALSPWPLLIAAIAAIVAGTRLLSDENSRELAAAVLLSIGAVCVGAWIALLASHGYAGKDAD